MSVDIRQQAEVWIAAWNQQFQVNEALVPAIYLRKAVSTIGTPIRRLLLEVYQYLSMTDVETRAVYVSKAWFHVSRDSEYWFIRYISDFHPSIVDSEGENRRKYIAYQLASCLRCKRLPSLHDIAWKCSYFQRPICGWCSDLPDFAIIPARYISASLKVTHTTLASLSVPLFLHDHETSCYWLHFEAKVLPYVEARRLQLVRGLMRYYKGKLGAEEMAVMGKFDFRRYYGSAKVRTRVEYALVKFCGRWREKFEDEKTCANRFLRSLKGGYGKFSVDINRSMV